MLTVVGVHHDLIGTEHLLLGLLAEPKGLAYEVLTAPDRSEQDIRDAVESAMEATPARSKTQSGHIPFSPDSKAAIEHALHASSDLGHDWVGTEHTLLGLIRTENSLAAQFLNSLGFTADQMHDTVAAEITRRTAPNAD